jgi:hypothetical protein
MYKEEFINRARIFICTSRKICWEAEYEMGEHCVGEYALLRFIEQVSRNLPSNNKSDGIELPAGGDAFDA